MSFRLGKPTYPYLQLAPLGPLMDTTRDITLTTSHSVPVPQEMRDGISLRPMRNCLASRRALMRNCILRSWTDLGPILLSARGEHKRWRTKSCGYVGIIFPRVNVFTVVSQGTTSNPHIMEERLMNNTDDSGVNEEDKYVA